jgi:hypothetical protein
VYTADSFEMPFEWKCVKADNRVIAGYVEWHDKVKIPDWCPCKTTNKVGLRRMILSSAVIYLDGKVIKDRYASEVEVVPFAEITNVELESWDEKTQILYLKSI